MTVSGHEIPLARTRISEEAIEAAERVLRSGWPGPGTEAGAFEAEFAAAIGAPSVVATSSGTAALELAVALLDLVPGDEVVTTPNTFVATNHVLLRAGLRPVFADIERDTGNIDVGAIARRVTDATRAIMVVHYAGYPCDLDAITTLAREAGLRVIEDCAHAAGAVYRGVPIGSSDVASPSRMCAFSFQATKNLTAVDGGALSLADPELVERARRLRWMGIDRSTFERHSDEGYQWEYDVEEVGFRSTMSDLNAALARVGLRELELVNRRRAEVAARYRDGLQSIPGVEPLRHEDDRVSSHCLFPVLADERDALLAHLRSHRIGAGVHYKSNDRFPVYEPALLPEAHWFSDHVLSLPMHSGLTDDEVDRVLEVLASRRSPIRSLVAPAASSELVVGPGV